MIIPIADALRCTTCYSFFLHKSCGELPREMNHLGHHLKLNSAYAPCDACGQSKASLRYSCSSCAFCLDSGCASLPETIEHTSLHQHPLTLLPKLSVFCCDACGITHEEAGLPYHCAASCNFWVHPDCASLPSTIGHTSHHQHPLTRVSSCDKSEIYKFGFYCDICSKEVRHKNCIYYCADCTYFAHVHWATSILPPDNSHQDPEAEDHPPPSTQISCLSMPDESSSIDLVNSLIEKISLLGDSKVGRGLKDGHCDHNSTLLDAETNEVCDACVRPISTPYYNCGECNLILHKSCAELPSEIQYPFHTPHLHILQMTPFLTCDACSRTYTGFSYGCRGCDFDLDIKCASLPTVGKMEF
ncbi:hypothetical protein RHMOL_Rhmol04G0132400 [Rhododendron molle]|uniref:Uncharacterized protein n=1 Tax=Rhododendron molle TaxID=49168 RepID=A0ACC0P152_RHOML|nr:hypothetical protein RHMOL_Rhmol04G0132400 [Rhododendron molle]